MILKKIGSIRVHYNTLLHKLKKIDFDFSISFIHLESFIIRFFSVSLTTKKIIARKLMRIWKTLLGNFFSQNFHLPTLKV